MVADFIQRKPYHQGSKNARDKPEGFDIRSSYEDDLIFATMQRSLFRSFGESDVSQMLCPSSMRNY